MSAGGVGIFAMYMLNNTGYRRPPCGTPCLIFLNLDFEPRNSISLSSSYVVDQKALDDRGERQLGDVIGKYLVVNSIEGSGQVDGNHDGAMRWFLFVEFVSDVAGDLLEGGEGGPTLPEAMLVVSQGN